MTTVVVKRSLMKNDWRYGGCDGGGELLEMCLGLSGKCSL